MSGKQKLSEKFFEVLKHEGVVAVVTWAIEPHIADTWNSYLVVTDDERILIPAAGFKQTEVNIAANNKVKMTLGSKEVPGFNNYQGTGFLIDGTARFITSGDEFDFMKQKFSWLSRVLEINVQSAKQLI